MISPSNDLYPFWVPFLKNQIVGTERQKSLGWGSSAGNRWQEMGLCQRSHFLSMILPLLAMVKSRSDECNSLEMFPT